MSFRFSLATLLRLREISEEREERALGRLLGQMTQVSQSLIEIGTQRTNLVKVREQRITSLICAAELHMSYEKAAFLDRREANLKEELYKLELLRQEQLRKYEMAHRDREVLSGMRDERLEQYRRDQVRHEQSSMDDNFSSRRAHT